MEWLPYSKSEETRFKNSEFFVGKGSWVPRLYQFRFLDYGKAYYSMYMPGLKKFLSFDSPMMHKAIMFPWIDTFTEFETFFSSENVNNNSDFHAHYFNEWSESGLSSMDWINRFTLGGFTVTYCTFQINW